MDRSEIGRRLERIAVALNEIRSALAADGSPKNLSTASEQERALLSRFGECDFTGVRTEAEARRRWEAFQRDRNH